jgi:hypothetical protein
MARTSKVTRLLIGCLSGVVRQPIADLKPSDTDVAKALGVGADLQQMVGGTEIASYGVFDELFQAKPPFS